jgi:peptidoglycan/LPS O-acetylase OafA/YrhL
MVSTARQARASNSVPVLDGLRGLAALLVVSSHASGLGLHLLPGLDLTGIGKYGVYLFFVLSAFLLTAQWLDAWHEGRGGLAFLRVYLVRRVLRIYPLYLLVLLIGLALAPRGLGVPLDAAAVWRHLSLQEGRDIYWSIPVEFLYYLLIPPLSLLLARLRSRASVAIVGSALFGLVQWQWPAAQAPLNSSDLGYYLPILLCGSLIAWLLAQRPVGPASSRQPSVIGPLDIVFAALLLLSIPAVFKALGLAASVDALHRMFLGWGLAWGLVLIALLWGRVPLWQKLLDTLLMRACGRWCFGIYLLHMPCLYLVRRIPLPEPLQAWLGLVLVLAVASIAHRLVEQPAIRFGQRIR